MKRMVGRTDETSGTERPSSLQHCDVFTVLVFFGVVNCLWRCQQTVASTFSLSGLVPVLLSFYFATWLPTPEGCRRCTYTNTLCRWLMMVNLLDDELANSPHPPASIAWRYTTNTTRPYFIFHVTVTMRHVGFPFSYTTTTFVFLLFFYCCHFVCLRHAWFQINKSQKCNWYSHQRGMLRHEPCDFRTLYLPCALLCFIPAAHPTWNEIVNNLTTQVVLLNHWMHVVSSLFFLISWLHAWSQNSIKFPFYDITHLCGWLVDWKLITNKKTRPAYSLSLSLEWNAKSTVP